MAGAQFSLATGIAALGSLRPVLSLSQAIEVVNDHSAEDIAGTILAQAASRRVLRQLEGTAPELFAQLGQQHRLASHVGRIEKVAAGRGETVALLDDVCRELDVSGWAIKGAVALRWYPDPEDRDLGDVDLMVPSAVDGFALAEELCARGYDYDERELPWLKRDFDGTIYGQVNLRSEPGGVRPNIDVHFGGYSVRHCARLPVLERVSAAGLGWYGATANLAVMTGNAAGDHWVTVKDLNDLYLALTAGEEIDWLVLAAQLGSVGLVEFFVTMLDLLGHTHQLDEPTEQLVAGLRAGRHREWPPPGRRPSRRRRTLATTLHAARVGWARSARYAGTYAATAADYYMRPLTLRLRNRPGAPPRLRELNNWTCIRLVPADLVRRRWLLPQLVLPQPQHEEVLAGLGDRRLAVVHTVHGDLVRGAGTVFVPTIHYDVPTELAAAAVALAPDQL